MSTCPLNAPRRSREHGYTLVETLVALGIAGVLASIAYPSFAGHVQRARRTDALVALMALQMAQERLYSNSMSYGSLAQAGIAAVSPSGHYRLEVVSNGSAGYEATATATGAQAGDANCRVLKLTVQGANAQQASGPDGSTANASATNRRCWSL
jgi:type IV pilus assembly protein PilE